jgi:hypothetical protein
MENIWNVGDRALITVIFTDLVTGLPLDPDVVTVKVDSPDPGGLRTTWVYGAAPEVVRDSQGQYHFYVTFTRAGTWFYRVEGTGSRVVAGEGALSVAQSHFYP